MQFLDGDEERKKHEAIMEEIEEEYKEWCKANGQPYDEDDEEEIVEEEEPELEETEEERLERYKNEFDGIFWIIDRRDILERLDEKIKDTKKDMEKDFSSAAFYRIMISLFMRFRGEIQKRALIEPLPSFWAYSIEIDEVGITLQMKNYKAIEYDGGNVEFEENECYNLFTVEPRMLTIEEYAAMYEVKPVTVRQWLRRGKIRTAVKQGREWRIPEITEPCRKGYEGGYYKILSELKGMPEEYKIVNQCSKISIEQEKAGSFRVNFYREGHREDNYWPFASAVMEEDERAKFELMLISSPVVKGINSLSIWDVIE